MQVIAALVQGEKKIKCETNLIRTPNPYCEKEILSTCILQDGLLQNCSMEYIRNIGKLCPVLHNCR